MGAFNSAHIFGTLVPVEEPSTASLPDSCSAAKSILIRSPRRRAEQEQFLDVKPNAFAVLRLIAKLELGRLLDRRSLQACAARSSLTKLPGPLRLGKFARDVSRRPINPPSSCFFRKLIDRGQHSQRRDALHDNPAIVIKRRGRQHV